ncbi:MAG TPA: hypothetical protein VFW38_06840 [Solirubrobacteraceae bacterium]|nr:hypothetical protein [Solirubrobacteraceae bacterium]
MCLARRALLSQSIALAAVVCACLALIALLPGSAFATPSAPSFLGEFAEGETPLEFETVHDMAVDRTNGDLYVAVGGEVTKLSPYGAFVLSFGKEVDETKVAIRKREQAKSEPVTVTAQEEDICTSASGDSCSRQGVSGQAAAGVAVEQASGNVFVVDGANHRVERFDSGGHFQLMFGMDVNKTKTAALASPPSPTEQAEANLCAAGEECQAGKAGPSEGELEELGGRPGIEVNGNAKVIAIGGASGSELVYVGDKARIEVFATNGKFVEQLSLSSISSTAKVAAIAADAAGEVFFSLQGVMGLHLANTNGGKLELTTTLFDSAGSGIEAVGVYGGSLYVADSSPSLRMLAYEVANPGVAPAEFAGGELAFEFVPISPLEVFSVEPHYVNAITVNSAGAVAVPVRAPLTYEGFSGGGEGHWPIGYHSGVNLYGSLSSMEASYGAPPLLKPAVENEKAQASVDDSSATLEAQINPQLRATSYQFEYGRESCATAECTKAPATLTSLGAVSKAEHKALAPIDGLEIGVAYHYRVVAENSAGVVHGDEHVLRIGEDQTPGPAVGLPDGRVYEQASPPNKHGNYVEATHARPAFVSPDGQSVMYSAKGGLTEASTNSAVYPLEVSERTSHGWMTRSTMPLPQAIATEPEGNVNNNSYPGIVVPSADLSRLLFATYNHAPYVGAPDESKLQNNLYLEGPNPLAEPEWVGRSQIEGQPGGLERGTGASGVQELEVAGTSPDLSTVYFSYVGKLMPGASELYEYRDGVLSDAGELPAGETATGPASPAAETALALGKVTEHATSAAGFDNQVSEDGSRIFFVRQDAAGTIELYAHVNGPDGTQRSELLSQSQLAGHSGEPASHGAYAMPSAIPQASDQVSGGQPPEHGPFPSPSTYAFASPDGSRVFFQSTDRLSEDAPEDATVKTYRFDLEDGGLTYIPAITGSIVAVSKDGSSLLFENTAVKPFALERWVAGAAGGHVDDIAELPPVRRNGCGSVLCVGPVYMTSDGGVITFATEAPIPGFNDGDLHFQLEREGGLGLEVPQQKAGAWPNAEIFRYDAAGDELGCVSCPPKGSAPTGNSIMSKLAFEDNSYMREQLTPYVDTSGRAMSANGSEVFFETRDALVPQDVNGTSDVYEWEDGKLYLISGGREPNRSMLLGISESGGDAFFATAEGIASGDTDGAYDVYDARVPRPGDRPVEAIPCEGPVCQGPPSVPNLLGQPSSEAFSGPGNPAPTFPQATTPRAKPKPLTRAQKLQRSLKTCRRSHSHSRVRRRACERRARERYGAKAAAHAGKALGNGRGK